MGEDTADITQNQERFVRRFPERLHTIIKQRNTIEGEYVELLGKQGKETFDSSTVQYSLKGWYYPVRLGDSYGLLLDCSVEHSLGNVQQAKNENIPVSCFTDLKRELEKQLSNTPSTIGQVWMLSGQLSNFTPDNAKVIVRECSQVNELNLNWDLDFRDQTQFLGGMLFEFWRYRLHIPPDLRKVSNIHDIQENNYTLIFIYPDENTAKKAAEFNFDWLRLFHYRSKIIWAYGQSQYLKKQLRNDWKDIKRYQEEFKKAKSGKLDLKKLRQTLVNVQDTLWNYSVNLNYLGTQKRTIEINLLNYERRLENIKQKLIALQTPNNLDNFQQFIEDVKRKYLLQIANDYESLNIGLTLLTDLINSIRGVTEIESSERDRTFQGIVAIFGVGLAAGSLAVSIAGQFPEAIHPKDAAKYPVGSLLSELGVTENWMPVSVLCTVSLGIGIMAALATALLIKIFELFKS
ncbi:Membrane-bound metallopeptidase (plasmid) [Nostoc flagelliforme CCNUN1]|uniref:Membrane-bound metallopeptidase n=1 Tax=Nostoc flagelliforme CCNUN1 TaxID=2038116 RepID=A0A2K8T9F7_9NOSO|nr:Membrane-bound metallopeptidase [Nostoc flagelliforme CCNUN1]